MLLWNKLLHSVQTQLFSLFFACPQMSHRSGPICCSVWSILIVGFADNWRRSNRPNCAKRPMLIVFFSCFIIILKMGVLLFICSCFPPKSWLNCRATANTVYNKVISLDVRWNKQTSKQTKKSAFRIAQDQNINRIYYPHACYYIRTRAANVADTLSSSSSSSLQLFVGKTVSLWHENQIVELR